ncbi:DUF1080 domain-containing protein [Muriicola sp. Z0-33]|nr:DUF1080 domain-containing protein [Muriicola sp. Z0-33]
MACGEKRQDKKEAAVDAGANMDEFELIFDGSSLKGWDGDDTYWRAENGVLIGEITPETLLKTNTFIIWQEGQPSNFELKLEFRISENGNSGINYRSERLDTIPFALRGYQADIDGQHRYTGQNYEERKRTTLAYRGERAAISTQINADAPGSLRGNIKNNAWQSRDIIASLGDIDSLKTKINKGWNVCHLIVRGDNLQHYVNGVLMSEVIDNDSLNRKSSGFLGFQVHVGPPMKVEYRNIRLKQL